MITIIGKFGDFIKTHLAESCSMRNIGLGHFIGALRLGQVRLGKVSLG